MELEIAAYGWQGLEWEGLYPEDLPPEWRLDYYGNEFSAIVVPASDWQAVSIDEANQWLEEVPHGFRFFWEIADADDAARLLEFVAGVEAERDKLGGWLFRSGLKLDYGLLRRLTAILPGAVYGDSPVPSVQTEQLAAEGITLCWQDGDNLNCRGNGLRVLQIGQSPDLRSLRLRIEEEAAAGTERLLLILQPQVTTFVLMRDLYTLSALLNS